METTGKNLIIVTGPESAGKTSVALKLAEKYGAGYYSEYARDYIQQLTRKYNYYDILAIANYQYEQFKTYCAKNELSIFDTYLIITKIWFLWHSNKYPDWIDNAITDTKKALYLLCAPDIAWEPDPVRENGGKARITLFNAYRTELENYGLDYRIISGEGELREMNAINFVEHYLKLK